jgi:hypothetical protein
MNNIKQQYLNLRKVNDNSESLMDLFAFVFKINNENEYLSDLLTNWEKFSGVTNSVVSARITSDLVLNSKLESNNHYFKLIDNIYANNKSSPDYFVQKAMAVFLDGNSKTAINV